jgi:HEAT repeat protein
MNRFRLSLLVAAALAVPGRAADATLDDEVRLKEAGVATDGAGLLAFFRARSAGAAEPDKVAALVARLADASPQTREKACGELVALGPAALPALRQAARDVDAAVSSGLARRCLKALEADPGALSGAAARLLAQRRPAGSVEALLAWLPFAADDAALTEGRQALAAVARRHGQPDPALVKALADTLPLRRAAAVDALCAGGLAEPRDKLNELLADPKPFVRLHAALALAGAREPKAVGALIEVLSELPTDQARQAEDALASLAGDLSPREPLGTTKESAKKCRAAWEAWWKATEGDAPLAEIRKRTLTEAERERMVKLVADLGDEDYSTRQKANDELRQKGLTVLPLLRRAVLNPDLEVSQRARTLVAEIEQDRSAPLSPAWPRVVALRRPEGAAEALLAFVPFTDDEGLVQEVHAALSALAWSEGKAQPAVVKALEDKAAARRAAAAVALCALPGNEHLAAVRKLLKDEDALVRLHTAVALAEAQDKAAVPVLIALIGELPSERSAPAEDYLRRLAGERGPADLPGGDAKRAQRRDAWAAWWAAHADSADLPDRLAARSAEHYLGHTLVVLQQQGTVAELGPDGKTLWQIGQAQGVVGVQDAQVVGPDRVLMAEYSARRVTERNFRGDVVWQKQLNFLPMAARRLHNGNTLISTRNQVVEIDRGGREVLNLTRPQNDVMSAGKGRDGNLILITSQGTAVRVDASGKELSSFRLQGISNYGNEVLPNGHVLIPVQFTNSVQEYDAEGKMVWSASVPQPMGAWRLANGNTLVALQQFPGKVVELDRGGKQVAEMSLPSPAFRVKRR